MRIVILFLLLLPVSAFSQNENYDGVYTYSNSSVKKSDTINEAYTFLSDSFRYSYSVRTRDGHVSSYEHYGKWHVNRLVEEFAPPRNAHPMRNGDKLYLTMDGVDDYGYFKPSIVSTKALTGELCFSRNGKTFLKTGKESPPLKK